MKSFKNFITDEDEFKKIQKQAKEEAEAALVRANKRCVKESFDTGFDWKWRYKSSSKYSAEFIFGTNKDDVMDVSMYRWIDDAWEIEFGTNIEHGQRTKKNTMGIQNFDDPRMKFKIFGTVLAIIKQFLDKVKPEVIYFTAKETSRKKLYKTMLNKFAKKIKMGFEIVTGIRGEDYYIMYRNKNFWKDNKEQITKDILA